MQANMRLSQRLELGLFSYYQWTDGSVHLVECERGKCSTARHRERKIYWAWDRSLGSWVHYTRS